MASKAVEDAVEAYLRANWSESVVLTENLEQEAPQDGAPFLTLEFPVSDSDWPGLSGVQWREEGAFRIALAVPRGEGMGRMRAWGETLANLFRGVDVGGEACCGVPDEPYTDDEASEGLYFVGTMVVPYYRLGTAAITSGPEWLPEGALVYADFTSADHYWADGAASSLDALFTGTLPVTGSEGLSDPHGRYAFDLSFLTLLSGPHTIVVDVVNTGYFVQNIVKWTPVAGGGAYYLDLWGPGEIPPLPASLYFYPGNNPLILAGVIEPDTVSRLALTFHADSIALSVDGGAVVTGVPITDMAFSNASLEIWGIKLRTLAIYSPADDADLPGLSVLA